MLCEKIIRVNGSTVNSYITRKV